MKRTTTPKIEIELPFDYNNFVEKFLVTFKQLDNIILEKSEKDDIEIKGNVISFKLTQEETSKFSVGEVFVDIKVLTFGKDVLASDIVYTTAEKVLNDKEFK